MTRREFMQRGVAAMASASPASRLLAHPMEPSMHDHDHHDGRHDFDFIHGRWRVQNERLRARLVGSDDWEVFTAIDECRPLLGGIGNLEEFHTTWNGGYDGLALRLYDLAARQWRIYWSSNRSGVLDPPVSGHFENGIGTFYGEDAHEGRPVRVRFLWNHTSANTAHWQQAFSVDAGATWETNWHMWFRRLDAQDRLVHEDNVLELRQYTMQPGQREVLVELFEREFIETQEAVGMHVIGHFHDLDAPDRFVWLRGFPSMEARREALQAFYFGPVWQQHRNTANATMIDSDNVLLLKPAHADVGLPGVAAPRPAIGASLPAGAICIGTCVLTGPAESFTVLFDRQLAPLLRQHGAELLATYVTDTSENTFPRLPVRAGERVFVWVARFDDIGALDAHLSALRGSSQWQDAIAAALPGELAQPPELLRLAPTSRSELR
jgi:hypothetical protein